MTGNNPVVDRSKLGKAKRYIFTDENDIPLSATITSANSHDIKAVIDVIDNAVVIKQPMSFLSTTTTRRRRRRKKHQQHLYALIEHIVLKQ